MREASKQKKCTVNTAVKKIPVGRMREAKTTTPDFKKGMEGCGSRIYNNP